MRALFQRATHSHKILSGILATTAVLATSTLFAISPLTPASAKSVAPWMLGEKSAAQAPSEIKDSAELRLEETAQLESTLIATPPPRLAKSSADRTAGTLPALVVMFGTGPAATTLLPVDSAEAPLATKLGFLE